MVEDILYSKEASDDVKEAIDHGILVSKLAYLLAKRLGEREEFCYEMAVAGMLHDIGKLKVGEYLYGRKKDSLAIEEMKYVRMHPELGYDIIKKASYDDSIALSVLHHHENYDGTGYPSNKKQEEIPYGSRILRICDVFSALISKRRYRDSFDVDTSIELMIEEVKNFDMGIFLVFLDLVHTEDMEEVLQYAYELNDSYDYE